MTRHAERVEQARLLAVVGARLIALYLVCSGLVAAAQYLSSYLMYPTARFGPGNAWAWIALGPSVSIVLGGVLWFGSARFARAVIRVRRRVCPGCGYALEGRPMDRCPECALFLGDGFMDPPVDAVVPSPLTQALSPAVEREPEPVDSGDGPDSR